MDIYICMYYKTLHEFVFRHFIVGVKLDLGRCEESPGTKRL